MNAIGDWLLWIAGIGKCNTGIERSLLEQVRKREVRLCTVTSIIQRIGRIRIQLVERTVILSRLKTFVQWPSKVQARFVYDIHLFPVTPANVTHVKHPWISISWIGTARIGPFGHSERIAQSQGPNPRAGGKWIIGLEKRITR